MSDEKIVINGKEIDYGNMTDEQLMKLYDGLLERHAMLKKAKEKKGE